MVKGYILVKLVPGLESDALSQIGVIPGVSEVNLVFGQWDAIAIAEAKSLFELARIIVGEIRGIQGVQDTTTLLQGEL
jgi:DNA-binding Lrp family transcriptional regulator